MTRTIPITITYLEMTERPHGLRPHPPHGFDAGRLMLVRAEKLPVAFYRYLYDQVGSIYHWVDRKRWSDEQLRDHLALDGIEVFVLYAAGAPAGYFELDLREAGACELAYFGLAPDFHGLGLGKFFLSSAISEAWSRPIQRLTVHTNTEDHPRALPLYQRMGFVPYAQERQEIVPL